MAGPGRSQNPHPNGLMKKHPEVEIRSPGAVPQPARGTADRSGSAKFSTAAMCFFALALLLVFAPSGEASRTQIHGPGIAMGSGVDIEVHALFDRLPRRGFAPLRVTISNSSGREQTWRFSFISSGHDQGTASLAHETTLTVANGEAKKFDILVPLARYNSYGGLSGEVYGHGILPGERILNFPGSSFHGGSSAPPGNAISPVLSYANWSKLDDSSAGGRGGWGGNINGATFDLPLLPSDWRAFSGFDAAWLTDQEWESTGAAERLALLDWVAAGGRLYLCREEGENHPLPGLAGLAPEQPLARGFGTVRLWPRSGDDLDIEETRHEMLSRIRATHDALENSYRRSTWNLLAKLPEIQIRKGLFIGFLLLFALVVGPVNLFFFARGTQRHRLFWTTPAISVGASLAIFLLILLQDGVGGTGHQLSVWSHLPDENKAAVLQEQASRTALLTGRRFTVETPIVLSTVNVQTLGSVGNAAMEAGPRSFGGDWFRNRATQGHLLEAVTATRWRIEAASAPARGSAPALLSTFPFTLDSVFYLDADGGWWHAAGLQPGQTQTFARVDPDAFDREWQAFLADAGAILERRASALSQKSEYFYAFSNESPDGTWTTLESIDWKTRRSLHIGPLTIPQP